MEETRLQPLQTEHKYLSLRIFCAELMGTALFIFFGNCTIAQVLIGKYNYDHTMERTAETFQYGDILTVALGYGLGLTLAIVASGTISGAHCNPAITVTYVFFRKVPATVLPVYLIAQVFGTFIGTGFVFTVHSVQLEKMWLDDIDISYVYFTSPVLIKYNAAALVWDQVLCSAIFMVVFFANDDPRTSVKYKPLRAINVGGTYGLLILATGINAGSGINPARDMVPRIFVYIINQERGKFPLTAFIPLVTPFFGCLLGGCVYYLMIGCLWPPEEEHVEDPVMTELMAKIIQVDKYVSELSKSDADSLPDSRFGHTVFGDDEYVKEIVRATRIARRSKKRQRNVKSVRPAETTLSDVSSSCSDEPPKRTNSTSSSSSTRDRRSLIATKTPPLYKPKQ